MPHVKGENETRGGVAEKKREWERRQRGRGSERVFVNAHKYKCLTIFNVAIFRTTL